jgi:hypothetical protein
MIVALVLRLAREKANRTSMRRDLLTESCWAESFNIVEIKALILD